MYFDQFTDFERFFDSKWLLYLENYLQKILQNILSSHQNFRRYRFIFVFFFCFCFFFQKWILFWNGKTGTFFMLLIYHLMQDYPFSSHYQKQCPINNIWVKCFQVGQNVSDIF